MPGESVQVIAKIMETQSDAVDEEQARTPGYVGVFARRTGAACYGGSGDSEDASRSTGRVASSISRLFENNFPF